MKKYYFLFLLLNLNISILAQEFKTGVKIIKIEKKENYKTPKSILIEFTGHTHLINFYKDLAKKLNKDFKRKSIKVRFNYSLNADNSLESDLKEIPKRKFNTEKFESVLNVKIKFLKKPNEWLNYKDVNYRKTQFLLESRLNNKLKKEILRVDLNTHAYYTIATQNKKVSKTIVNLITEKN